MAFVLCERGHYFDSAKKPQCPFCAAASTPPPQETTVALQPPDLPRPAPEPDLNKIPGFALPVGWLVAVDGPSSGHDYRLLPGNNWIGSQPDMAVSIPNDPALSPRDHASVVYDGRGNAFMFRPGGHGGVCYVNDQLTLAPAPLRAGDRLLLGTTTLIFVPLASDNFRW